MTKLEELDLVTTVNLAYQGNGKEVYYFVYASELYGTMFAIYAKFDGVKSESEFVINKITMRLINYKGIINIGFTDDYSIDSEEMTFGVMGTSTVIEKEFPSLNHAPIEIEVRKETPLTFNLNRNLYPMPGFEDFQRDNIGRIDRNPPLTQLFDSEFYERDGLDFYKLEPRIGKDGYERDQSRLGPRCASNKLILTF